MTQRPNILQIWTDLYLLSSLSSVSSLFLSLLAVCLGETSLPMNMISSLSLHSFNTRFFLST